MPSINLVALGVIARPHGLQGELRVHIYNDSSRLLSSQRRLWMRARGSEPCEVTVQRARPGPKGAVLLTLPEVSSREAADALRGSELCVLRSRLPELGEDEWYHVDLVGLRVVSSVGDPLGEVVEVLCYPTVDCLVVRGVDGDREVPMLEPWLGAVDLASGTVRVERFDELPLAQAKGPSSGGAG